MIGTFERSPVGNIWHLPRSSTTLMRLVHHPLPRIISESLILINSFGKVNLRNWTLSLVLTFADSEERKKERKNPYGSPRTSRKILLSHLWPSRCRPWAFFTNCPARFIDSKYFHGFTKNLYWDTSQEMDKYLSRLPIGYSLTRSRRVPSPTPVTQHPLCSNSAGALPRCAQGVLTLFICLIRNRKLQPRCSFGPPVWDGVSMPKPT